MILKIFFGLILLWASIALVAAIHHFNNCYGYDEKNQAVRGWSQKKIIFSFWLGIFCLVMLFILYSI